MAETTLIRLHSLGDVVLAQPLASALADRDGSLRFITSVTYAPIVERMPGKITPVTLHENHGSRRLRILAGKGGGAVYDLQNNLTTRIACMGRDVQGRFKMDRRRRRDILKGSGGSMDLRSDEFLAVAGFPPGGEPHLDRVTKQDSLDGGLRVGIIAGGRWRLKSIPSGVVSETARILIDVHGASVHIIGGPGDAVDVADASANVKRPSVDVYCGQDGVEGLIQRLESLDILISPDSGPAHLACALGVKTLLIFTSTTPGLGFWRHGSIASHMVPRILCRPCHRHGGRKCKEGTEFCRKRLLPVEMARKAMELTGS